MKKIKDPYTTAQSAIMEHEAFLLAFYSKPGEPAPRGDNSYLWVVLVLC